MAKVTTTDLENLQNEQSAVSTINANFTLLENAIENTLSRDGTSPNTMSADLDMNSNNILNLPAPASSTEPLRLGDLPDILPTIISQNDAPATTYTEGSLWIDANSTDLDVYQLSSTPAWVDTGVNLKGATGATGAAGANGADGDQIFVQNDAPATTYTEGSIWIDANSADIDLYTLTGGAWVDSGVNLKGQDGILAGSTGVDDNRLLRSDGVGGATVQASAITVDDSGNMSGVGTVSSGAVTSTGTSTFDTIQVDNAGLKVQDTDASHHLVIKPGSNLTAERILTVTTGDAARTVTINGDSTLVAGTTAVIGGGQTLTGGFDATAHDLGTVSTGTTTLTTTSGNLKRYVNNGAHTLAPPSSGDSSIVVQVTNGVSAGAITTSGWTKVTGDSLTTTNGDDFLLYCTRINGFTHLHVQALQ